jgi:hypothetical protein
VVSLGLVGTHAVVGELGVAARSDRPGQDDRHSVSGIRTHTFEKGNAAAVHSVEGIRRVAKLRAPVRARTPGRRVEHETDAALARDGDEAVEVLAKCALARLVVQQDERREEGELETGIGRSASSPCRRR